MRFSLAILALVSGAIASPTAYLKPRQANTTSTWPFLPAMKQFIADYEAGKKMDWVQVGKDTGLWHCQAQYIAQGGSGVAPAAVSASASASKSSTSVSASKASSSSASSSGSASKFTPSSAASSASVNKSSSASSASKRSSSSIAASSSASKSASSSASLAGVQPAVATASSSSKAATASSSSSSSAAKSSSSSSAAKSSSSSSAAKSSSSSSAAKPSSSSTVPTSSSSSVAKPSSSSSSAAKSSTTTAATSSSSSKPIASSSSSSAAPAASQDTVNKAQFLSLHNDFRPRYGANVVTWNDTLAAYAFKAASTCQYGHTRGPYGENIAAGVGGGYNVKSGFTSWSNESTVYDWSKPGYSDATGHFTQIVWKATTQIGCAAVSCPDNTIFKNFGQASTYLVCEYYQPGNLVDPSNSANTAKYFTDNVGKFQG